MRILHVTPSYYPATYWGGPIFSVYGLCNALAKIPGIDLRVLTTDAAGPRAADRLPLPSFPVRYDGYDVYITRRVLGRDVAPSLMYHLWHMVRWADIVHLTGVYCFPTIPVLVAARIFRKPVVWSPRGSIQAAYEWDGARRKWAKRVWEGLCNMLIRRGDVATHTTAEPERMATQIRIPQSKAIIVRNGVEVLDVPPVRGWQPEGRLRLMYMGRLSQKKGIENLLDALKWLNDPGVSLAICGTGDASYVRELMSRAEQLGIGVVTFSGHVDGAAKASAFQGADVCVVPSFTENFCMVVAEALGRGVPVIASRGTPWSDIEGIGCGLWVDNSPESLARAITRIRSMPLQEMGHRGWRWMKEEFSWESVASEMLEVYRSQLREHPNR